MASEIRVDKINSLSGVGTVTLSPTGIDIAGITTAATLRATTGIVTTLTATTGIVTTLTANTVTSLGAVSGTTGTFSGAVSGTTGTFTGDVDIADKIVHTGDTNTAIRFPAADTVSVETGGTEALRVDSSQRLVLGATSQRTVWGGQQKLSIEGLDGATSSVSIVRNSNDAFYPFIALGKSRGTSDGSSTIVQDDDVTGIISFNGADGGDMNPQTAYIESAVDGTPGTDDMPGRLSFYTTADGAYSSTERLRITSGGEIGINNSSPDNLFKLDVNGGVRIGNNVDGIIIENAGSNANVSNAACIRRHASTGNLHITAGTSIARNLIFGTKTSGGEIARFTDTGLCFNGDTAATNALDDYEEGTWTPTVTDGGSAFGTNNASYVKIGKMVTVSFDLLNNSGGNIYQVFGLPFAVAQYAAFNIAWISNNQQGSQGASDIQGGLITTSSNHLGFRVAGGNNSINVANNVRFIGSGTYETS